MSAATGRSGPLLYSDAEAISTWAQTAAAFCQKTEVILGRESGAFDPRANATRAETAAILKRVIQYTLK